MGDGCDTCDGDEVVDVDRFAPGRGHFTVTVPCPTCQGEQLAFDFDDEEDTVRVIDLDAALRESLESAT